MPPQTNVSFNVSSSEAEISAQMRAHAGADFDGIERLCYVVVRADVETQNLIGVFAFRREKNHGNIAYLPDFGKGGHTVLDGHHYVHKNEVYVFPFDNAQSLFAVACGIEFIRRVGKIYFERVNNIFFVVANKQVVHIVSLLYKLIIPQNL